MSDERVSKTSSQPMEDHYCMAKDCKKWGCYGFNGRYGYFWYCEDHRAEGQKVVK